MGLRVDRLHYPVHVLGPGVRAAIWTQGCTIRCPGCMSTHTWAAAGGVVALVPDLVAWLRGLPEPVDGLTVSGGEPTDQPEGLALLLVWLQQVGWSGGTRDVLVYTGRPVAWVSEHAELFAGADAVIAEPFDVARVGQAPLLGSDNQVLLALTPLGRERYLDGDLPSRDMVQIDAVHGQLRSLGVPGRNVLPQVRQAASQLGLQLKGASWQ